LQEIAISLCAIDKQLGPEPTISTGDNNINNNDNNSATVVATTTKASSSNNTKHATSAGRVGRRSEAVGKKEDIGDPPRKKKSFRDAWISLAQEHFAFENVKLNKSEVMMFSSGKMYIQYV
jgi:hypothetical protein